MTENEANLLVSLSKHNSSMYGYELSKTEINMILKLFDDVKELEQYRAIGTVEEVKEIRNKAIDEFAEAFDKWVKSDTKRTYYWTEFQVELMKIAEQMKATN